MNNLRTLKIILSLNAMILLSCNNIEKIYFDKNYQEVTKKESAVYVREVENLSYQEIELSTGDNIGYGDYSDENLKYPKHSIWKYKNGEIAIAVEFDDYGKKEEVKITNMDGQALFRLDYKNGILHGNSFVHDSSGPVILSANYKQGELNGLLILNSVKKNSSIAENYENGKQNGKINLKINSSMAFDLIFEGDQLVSVKKYHSNGALAQSHLSNHREYKYYDTEGKLVYELKDNGKKAFQYYNNGEICEIIVSKDGRNWQDGEQPENYLVIKHASEGDFSKTDRYIDGKLQVNVNDISLFSSPSGLTSAFYQRQSEIVKIVDSINLRNERYEKEFNRIYGEVNNALKANIFELQPISHLLDNLKIDLEEFVEENP